MLPDVYKNNLSGESFFGLGLFYPSTTVVLDIFDQREIAKTRAIHRSVRISTKHHNRSPNLFKGVLRKRLAYIDSIPGKISLDSFVLFLLNEKSIKPYYMDNFDEETVWVDSSEKNMKRTCFPF